MNRQLGLWLTLFSVFLVIRNPGNPSAIAGYSVRTNEFKLIWRKGSAQLELYDMTGDSGSNENIINKNVPAAAKLLKILLKNIQPAELSLDDNSDRRSLPPEVKESLKRMGYLAK